MASSLASAPSAESKTSIQHEDNNILSYLPINLTLESVCAHFRTWKAILNVLQHPTYTSPSLKSTLESRISTLQNCADAYPVRKRGLPAPGDFVTVGGMKLSLTSSQKELTEKLARHGQIDIREAAIIVLQQARVGVNEFNGVVRAYMEERTAVLRVVKFLLQVNVQGCANKRTESLATELVPKVKGSKEFSINLLHGMKSRVDHSPPNSISDPLFASLWSRQVQLFFTRLTYCRQFLRSMSFCKYCFG